MVCRSYTGITSKREEKKIGVASDERAGGPLAFLACNVARGKDMLVLSDAL
jgi:hypothetical protein